MFNSKHFFHYSFSHRKGFSFFFNPLKKLLWISLLFIPRSHFGQAVLKDVLKVNREKLYRNMVKNTITGNLSVSLNDSTEDRWQDAFSAMELISYHSPWADNRIQHSFYNIETKSISFQRSIIELVYTNYPRQYVKEINSLLLKTKDVQIFSMCAVYLFQFDQTPQVKNFLIAQTKQRLSTDNQNAILQQLQYQLNNEGQKIITPSLQYFLEKDYLPQQVLLFSFQRKNRNYPGLAMIRDTSGNMLLDESGEYFSVPQLARSISNLPGYLTNGNTPEGLLRMDGFDHSQSNFIGPTTNIQLTLPFEFKASHFYNDSVMIDSVWDPGVYRQLLPQKFRDYYPMYQTYYAGKAGRTEIIAHGTAMDPEYFRSNIFYPLVPTQGCLSTKEIWDPNTGTLMESDQQKLSDAILRAGGPQGYAIVINIDDSNAPVTSEEVLLLLKLSAKK